MLTPPTSAATRELSITQARRNFFSGAFSGSVSASQADHVAPWISQSWQRCLSLGHEPSRIVDFSQVTQAHLRQTREVNAQLSQAAREVIDQLGKAVAAIHYFAILTNAQGIVIATAGQINPDDRRAWLIAREGVDLSEQAVGTTAIGAVLHEHRDVWLHRGEHFFDDTCIYSCAGSPIFGADGQCVGMLDLTGIDAPERPELVHLVSSAARRIENRLTLATAHSWVLHLRWPGSFSGGSEAEGLVCLDEDGLVKGMNSMARQMLGRQVFTPLPQTYHASELFAIDYRRLYESHDSSKPLSVPLWSGLPVEVHTRRHGSQARSSIAAVTAPAAALHNNTGLKAQETALIRATVSELKGNVAATAEKLGISRATIYRKLATHKNHKN